MSEYAEPLSQAQLVREMTYARDSGVELTQGDWLRPALHPLTGEPICRACLVGVLIWQQAGVTDWHDALQPLDGIVFDGPLTIAARLTNLDPQTINGYSNGYEDARAERFGPFLTSDSAYKQAYNTAYAATVEVFGDTRTG